MKRLLVVLLLVACSAEQPASPPAAPEKIIPPPTAAETRALLEGMFPFSDFELTTAGYSLPMQAALRNAPANDAASKLARAKWISLDGDGMVALTAKAKADKRFIVRTNWVLDIVPLAKKNFGEITGVRMDGEGNAKVDFTWTWTPNELGSLLFPERFAGTQHATATLMWDGSTWTILKYERLTPSRA
jgi:hypothetical protein